MSQKLSIDIELNAQQYKQGAQQATQSTEDLKKATDDYLKDYGSLRKQLVATKKEAQNLAGAFASLSAVEKKSEFGQELKAQMDIAIEKAAELQDVMGDTAQAIKNASSDTATWDALKEGFEVAKSAAMTYASAIAKVTGNEEDLAKLVKTLTLLENGFNTVIKVGNALQQQSAIMTGIRKVQMLAAAKAEEIGTATTVKATIAQKAFNAVAKAHPYVLLGTAAIAAATAIGGYMLSSKKAEKSSDELSKSVERLKEIQKDYVSTVSSEFGKLMSTYSKLKIEWNKLSTEQEKSKWIKENAKSLKELGIEAKTVADVEAAFNKNSAAVIDGFRKRAQAAALAAQAVTLYTKSMEIEQEATDRLNQIRKRAGDRDTRSGHTLDANGQTYNNGTAVLNNGVYEYTAKGAAEANKELFKTDSILKGLSDEYKQINNLIDENLNKQAKLASSVKTVDNTVKDTVKNQEKTAEIKIVPVPKLAKDFDKKLQETIKKANDKIKEEFEKSKIESNAILNSPINVQTAKNKVAKAEKVPVELDFEIPDNMSDQISEQRTKLDHLTEALAIANTEKIKFANVGDTNGVAAMTEEIDRLTKSYNENATALENSLSKAERIADISEGFKQASSAVGAFGDMFSALGDATDDAGLKVMGIIAQAIATITLSFAQALTSCKTWVDWLIFGITGMTTMITMISQIKNLTAGSYAQGGIIPGNSYSGDRLIASVNSREMILNTKQQSRLLDIANGIISPANGNYIVNVQGKIKGTDIVLVSKNTSKILSKSSTNIYF